MLPSLSKSMPEVVAATCLAFDFQFFSEEFPEFVGSARITLAAHFDAERVVPTVRSALEVNRMGGCGSHNVDVRVRGARVRSVLRGLSPSAGEQARARMKCTPDLELSLDGFARSILVLAMAASASCERNDGESRSAAAPVDSPDRDASGSALVDSESSKGEESTRSATDAAPTFSAANDPEWQAFNDPDACAVIGQCRPDEDATAAKCSSGRCELVFP